MADCGSLESLLTSLTNEVSALKAKVANLESKKNEYALKSELANAIDSLKSELANAIEGLKRLLDSLLGRNDSQLESRVRNLETRVSGLESIFNSLNSAISQLKSRFARIESKISGLENTVGQILMDVKNIYNILSKLKNFDPTSLWVAIGVLQGQIAAILIAIANLAKLFRTLPVPRNGRDGRDGKDGENGSNGSNGKDGSSGKDGTNGKDGKDGKNGINGKDGKDGINGKDGSSGKNGTNGKDGINGKDGSSGKDGTNGKDGKDGKNGINGKDGEDLEMKFSLIPVTIFDGCNGQTPVFSTQTVKVLKGLEGERSREFLEIAKIRASECTSCCADSDGEIFNSIEINTVDKKFIIPSQAEKLIVEFSDIKSYISTRFSSLYPKYKDSLGTISFIINDAQQPDIFLQYRKIILDIPKGYKNNTRYGYIYLNDCKAVVSFWKKK